MKREAPLAAFLHEAKAIELEKSLKARGYRVYRNRKESDLIFDLVAAKAGGPRLYFEIKSRPLDREGKTQLRRMLEYVRSLGDAQFSLVVAKPPRPKDVEVMGLDRMLRSYLCGEVPPELPGLPANARIEDVTDIDVDSVRLDKNAARVSGTGTIVYTQIDSGRERKAEGSVVDSCPFEFDLLLNRDLAMREVMRISAGPSVGCE